MTQSLVNPTSGGEGPGDVQLVEAGPGGPRLAVHHRPALRPPARDPATGTAAVAVGSDAQAPPFLLVHGVSSNARLWDGVAAELSRAGHESFAVDLRGHGRSESPDAGYDTDTCADDLAALIGVLGLTGGRAPVAAGQSWGGNVVLSLAARHPAAVAAVALVDGGWIRLHDRFATFEDCWSALAPPRFEGLRYADLATIIRKVRADWPPDGVDGTLANLVELPDGGVRARLSRDRHREIVRSLYEDDPADLYPRVPVPAVLVPALGAQAQPDEGEREVVARAAVRQALAALPDAEVRWYAGADHDLHAQHPQRLAADLLALAGRVGAAAPHPSQEPDR